MTAFEVRFASGCGIDVEAQAEIEAVLRRIPVGSNPGNWPNSIHAVEVIRRLTGGRTGSDVFDLRIHDGGSERCVAKLCPAEAAMAEWEAFRRHIADKDRALLLKIKAVTDGALGASTGLRGDREAVIYQHVAEFAAEPEASALTLEDVVAAAFRGGHADTAVRAIHRLMRQARIVLYRDAKPAAQRTQLRWLNPTLGPDLVVEVDNVTPDGELRYQSPLPADLDRQRVYSRDVILAACLPGESEDQPIAPGSLIRLQLDEIVRRGDRTIGLAPDVAVEIRIAKGVDDAVGALVGRKGVDLHARVLTTRTQVWWQRVAKLLPGLVADEDGVLLDGMRMHHPFQQLGRLLVDTTPGWVASLVHGDLNPRNILLVAEQLCLIDYAKIATDQPLLGDPAWLEVNLLRDVIAGALSRPELVQLQRLLAAAGRHCVEPADPGAPVAEDPKLPAQLEAMLSGASPALDIAFRILWTLRAGARDAYPNDQGCGPWWREYLGALTLAACRTLKWPDDEQTENAIAATVVVAATAAEFLDATRPAGPFGNWSMAELTALTAAFVQPPNCVQAPDESLLADVMAAIDRLRDGGKEPAELAQSLATARDMMATAKCGAVARRLLPRLRVKRGPFIRLRGHLGGPDESGREPDVEVLPALVRLPAAVLLGDAGSGKSTLLRELQARLLAKVAGEDEESDLPARMPILVRAADAARVLKQPRTGETDLSPAEPGEVLWQLCGFADLMNRGSFAALLTIGGFQLLVDGFDEPSTSERTAVAKWLRKLRCRYPRAPLVVCQRSFGYDPEILDLPAVTLHQMDDAQTVRYITEALRAKQLRHADDCVREVVDGLLDSTDYRQLRELTRTPLFLWMIVEWYAAAERVPTTAGELFSKFTDWYLDERHHAEGERRRSRYALALKRAVLQAIARELVERGNITELPADQIGALCADVVPGGPTALDEVLEEIVDTEMLQRDCDRVRFLHQLFQEYFAACALDGEDREALAERVRTFFWREPIRMLLSSPDTSQELIDFVLERAIDTEPRYAAWLLRAVRHRSESPWLPELFVTRQAERLRSPATGGYGWLRAARGLAEYATRPALDELAGVAADASAPDPARGEAIDALLDAYQSAVADGVRGAGDALRRAVTTVLKIEAPAAVTVRALRAAAEAGLSENAGLVWDLVDPALPWSVVNAAYQALIDLGMERNDRTRGCYLEACEHRLAEVEAELRVTVLAEQVDRLQDERITILGVLADAGALEAVLARRFAFGLADRPGWADILTVAAGHERNAANPLARLVDTPATAETEWLRIFADGEDLAACAVAHRLLADGAAPPEVLLGMVTPESSVPRLLVAAAVVECLGPPGLGPAEDLVRGLIEAVDAGRPELLEPLAALVSALETSDRLRRIVLAHRATSVLREREVRSAMYWPWARALCDTVLEPGDLAWLLDEGEDCATVAAEYMSGIDFLSTASARPPELYLSPGARRRLHARRPASPDGPDACRFVLTASFAGMVELLPYVIAVARSETNRTTMIENANSGYGLLTVTLASHAISAIGYLGRVSADNGRGDAFEAYRLLHDLDTSDLHPSLERARLVGLGFLGHWQTILERLTPDDVVHSDAAQNIVAHWVPGPCTPVDQGPAEIARWIERRLTEQTHLDPRVRSALERIKVGLESIVGRYVGGHV